MEWISKSNEAVAYIEENLNKEISYDKAAQIAPTGARNKGVSLKAYPRISLKITIIGDAETNCKITKKDWKNRRDFCEI